MHIDVSDILNSDLGTTKRYKLTDEKPDIADIVLISAINGTVELAKLEIYLIARANLVTTISLECYRCLQQYKYPLQFEANAQFAEKPSSDQWPITEAGEIDIAPIVREEILVHTPMQQICRPECPGLPEAALYVHNDIKRSPKVTKKEK